MEPSKAARLATSSGGGTGAPDEPRFTEPPEPFEPLDPQPGPTSQRATQSNSQQRARDITGSSREAAVSLSKCPP
jgi:hypothetical protein